MKIRSCQPRFQGNVRRRCSRRGRIRRNEQARTEPEARCLLSALQAGSRKPCSRSGGAAARVSGRRPQGRGDQVGAVRSWQAGVSRSGTGVIPPSLLSLTQDSRQDAGGEDRVQARPEPSSDAGSETRAEVRFEPALETGIQFRAQRGRELTSETRNQASFDAMTQERVQAGSETPLEPRTQAGSEVGPELRLEARVHPRGDPPLPGPIPLIR